MSKLFKMGGDDVSARLSTTIQISGLLFFLCIWTIITEFGGVNDEILPSPLRVIMSYVDLFQNDYTEEGILIQSSVLSDIGLSVKLNLLGYIEAIAISLPLGFLIGLFPFFRNLLGKYVDSIRFLPLTAMTGIFIAWFGIYDPMKIHFLALGIIVYLLPIVVQRIDEVQKIHVQTVWTLGANNWQLFRTVYLPSIMGKLINDIRIITAISWTYIIVAEMINQTGGIGARIFLAGRQSKPEQVFAMLILIIIIGIIQDKIFKYLDKWCFPYKYV